MPRCRWWRLDSARMAAHQGLAKGQSIDDALLDGAVQNLSPEEVSARLKGALSPARVILRTKELLRDPGYIDEIMRERALLRVLEYRVTELQRSSDNDSIKLQATLVKELLAQLNRRKSATDDQLNTYNANIGRQIGHVVDLTLTYMKGALREQVDAQAWDTLVLEAMAMAWHEIEKKQVGE